MQPVIYCANVPDTEGVTGSIPVAPTISGTENRQKSLGLQRNGEKPGRSRCAERCENMHVDAGIYGYKIRAVAKHGRARRSGGVHVEGG